MIPLVNFRCGASRTSEALDARSNVTTCSRPRTHGLRKLHLQQEALEIAPFFDGIENSGHYCFTPLTKLEMMDDLTRPWAAVTARKFWFSRLSSAYLSSFVAGQGFPQRAWDY
jgi:hypothetical protein